MKRGILFIVSLLIFFPVLYSWSQDNSNAAKDSIKEGYVFKDNLILKVTPVEDQYRSGTCWAFSGLAFLEAEMIRMGKPGVNLSEMFIVWHAYSEKAWKHIRLHGSLNFSAGGAFHDVINVMKKYGIVPEEVFTGLSYGEEKHVHGELDNVLLDYVNAVIENKNRKLSTTWHDGVEGTLNAYLGEIPQKFTFNGKEYSPLTFASDYVGLDLDNYVEISSYTHHPFYTRFVLEVPDNWSWDEVYNVPLDDLNEIIDYSLGKGYTVAWAADVSEKGFLTSNKGVAVLPDKKIKDMTDAEITRWEVLSDREKEEKLYRLEKPVEEMIITQELRQIAFDNYQTTDDHGMLIMGKATDQTGNTFYKVKNSWGEYNHYKGYFYASKPYIQYKTMSIMVNKNAIPPDIRKKLNL